MLVGGAELLVRGASGLALALGISPLVVGLTVVALGTSAPELAVTLSASLRGQPDLALGNVVGSNICNVLLILGVSALVTPLVVVRQLVWREVPLMVGVSGALLLMCLDGRVSRLDGAVLVAGGVGYTAWTVVASRRERRQAPGAAAAAPRGPVWRDVLFVAVGLALLVLGSRWLVAGAVAFARVLGVSELVIGLTLIAGGTSLPEVATSLLAAMRGERDIAVGNVVGSNIFNVLAVLGFCATVAPGGVAAADAVVSFDLPVMLAVAVACLPIFRTGHVISRWEGGVFFAYYVAYTAYLVLDAQQHDALHGFTRVMGWFVLPLTALTLAILLARGLRRPRPA
ncbi:calcium/sodium antiporter [Myxococcus sp. AM009]|nr:calcium/sodium antiporter [Myxococcus sp. AM009]